MSTVRTRFAPSPTGYLHIGGARTALFNYLYARHHGGVFVLRIEDTDRERSTQPSIDAILDAMTWLGLEWDEGPFYQTELVAVHREHVERMLSAGSAYRCTCTAEDLEAKRATARAAGRNPVYDRTCRDRRDVPAGVPFTVRLRAPIDGTTVVPDLIRGNVEFRNTELDDIILLRSDGTPTYNLGVVVDDALMRITHIIRGEDHLSNTPKQIQIYRALGFDEPKFAHIPLILGTDRARLSKRHGATSVMAYRDMGYLADGLVNYLARLGWSHGDQEIFTRTELVEKFGLDSVGAAAGVYNPEKAEWVNGCHLKAMSPAALAETIRPYITMAGLQVPERQEDLETLVGLLRERANTLVEMVEGGRFFLCDRITLDPDAAAKHLQPAIHPPLQSLRNRLAALPEWSEESVHLAFIAVTDEFSLKLGKVAQPVRVAVTGGTASPGIFEVLVLLGRERSLARLDNALAWVEERARNVSAT
jgi:glutamyl-tRNA synthetase